MKVMLVCLVCIWALIASAAGYGFPMDTLPILKDFEAMRSSSANPNWRNGNGDCRPIGPGETLTLAELDGPGRIAHIWFTIADDERFYGKKLVLKMFWDGENNPSVESPLNDFFCQGHGLDLKVASLPFRVTSNGRARNCYFSMPFRKSAKVQITNQGKQPVGCVFWYIDWQKLKGLPKDTGYFHAKYRQEYPCKAGEDYVILRAEGKGHFVGCNLSVRARDPGWWGEGDDRFFIDGEKEPRLRGTGSEDYFCDAWGLRQFDGLFYGTPLVEGYDVGDRTTAYRFHIADPVPFKKSLLVTIEHKGAKPMPDGKWDGFAERADDFSSVAYWYQTEPHVEFAPLPPAEERIYQSNEIIIEGESLLDAAEALGPKPTTQQLGGWSGGAQLFFTPGDEKASLTLKFALQKAGRYRVAAQLTHSFDYGTYEAYLDGNRVGPRLDLYSPDVALGAPAKLGWHDLKEGEHTLSFQCVGKNAASAGYYFGLDYISLASE